jgi:hypothetical protein
MDGAQAVLFLNGRKVAEKPWPLKPQWYFRDVTNPDATTVYLGRDFKGSASQMEIQGFRAHNVALADAALAVP